MTPSLDWAKAAAVLSVIYAGANVYQCWARFADTRDKAAEFAAVAAGGGGPLRFTRALFYLGAPLLYLWSLLAAGLPSVFLAAAGLKFWISSLLGLRTEHRLIRGEEYRAADHRAARVDAAANILLACVAVALLLRRWG
jgi:hypothetical protein